MARYNGGGGGGGGGAVTSFAGRTGAVAPQLGDYSSDLIHNASGVFGSTTISAALIAIAAAIPAAVTVAGTAPISVTGGPNYTVSIANPSNASKGAVPEITAGSAVLTSNGGGTSASWVALSGGGTPVGSSRNINTTAPLAGGGSLAADLTLSIPQATSTTAGIVPVAGASGTVLASDGTSISWVASLNAPANPTDNGKTVIASGGNFTYLAGTLQGQALTWDTTSGWIAGVNFGALTPTASGGFTATGATTATTTFVSIGPVGAGAGNAASTGNLRVGTGFVCKGLQNNGAADIQVWDWGLTTLDVATWGSGSKNAQVIGGVVTINAGGTVAQFTSAVVNFVIPIISFTAAVTAPTLMQAASSGSNGHTLSILGQSITGANVNGGSVLIAGGIGGTGTGHSGNIYFGGASANDQAMGLGIFMASRNAAPTGNPTAGFFHWAETGGIPTWRTVAGDVFGITGASSTSATLGAATSLPALPLGYMGAVIGATAVKIAYYSP